MTNPRSIRAHVQAVPERLENIKESVAPEARQMTGVEPLIHCDCEHMGNRWNFLRILETIVDSGQPGLLLQDDVVIHADAAAVFYDAMQWIDEMEAVSLFAPPRKEFDQLAEKGCNFVLNRNFLWMQGVVFTPGIAARILYFADRTSNDIDDGIVKEYCWETGTGIWTTVPSLVQHNVNMRSTLKHPWVTGRVVWRTNLWPTKIDPAHFKTDRRAETKAKKGKMLIFR